MKRLLVIIGLCALLQATAADAQCVFFAANNLPSNVATVAASFTGSFAGACTVVANNAICNAGPTSIFTSSVFTFIGTGTGTSPSCQWTCGTCVVTLTAADGLPVELLELEIE
jgi:hypothetical protein